MQYRSSLRLTACLAAGLALVAAAHPASAQDARVIINGGDRVVVSTNAVLPISEDALRKLIETHLPDALLADADAHHVSIVIDANDHFVSGKVTKATTFNTAGTVVDGLRTFVVGDSTAGGAPAVITMRRNGEGPAVVGPSSVSVIHARVTDGEAGPGALGAGYDPADIASIGFRRFAAGDFATTPLVVSVIKLK